jgi:hypothetical protein
MSIDITYCNGNGCAVKNDCRRFKEPQEYKGGNSYQSWIKPPFKIKKGVFSCKLFWGVQNDVYLVSLMDIFGLDSNKIMEQWNNKKKAKKK